MIEYLTIERKIKYIQYESSLKSNNVRNCINYSTLKTISIKISTIIIYVDDLLITNFNKQFNKNIKTIFNKQFHIIDFDFIIHYFDIKLDQNKFQRILWFNQRVYLKKIFKNYDFFDNKSIVTFIKTLTKLKTVFIEYIINFDFKHIY